MLPIERYLEGKLPGLKIEAKRSPDNKAIAMKCYYKGKMAIVGFKSPCGAEQMLKTIRSKL